MKKDDSVKRRISYCKRKIVELMRNLSYEDREIFEGSNEVYCFGLGERFLNSYERDVRKKVKDTANGIKRYEDRIQELLKQ